MQDNKKNNFGNNIGYNLSIFRQEAGMSRKELAEILNVHVTTVARYEEGKRIPDIEIIIRIAKLFNKSCDNIVL